MNTLNESALMQMLELQDKMNKKIDPQWLMKKQPFLRAVLVESIEALEHFGWKWWKQQIPDTVQLRIELIDIWHFLLSEYLLRSDGDKRKAATQIQAEWQGSSVISLDEKSIDLQKLDLREKLELLAALSAIRRTNMPLIAQLFSFCELNPDSLYQEYISKNILNHFRQDHGYKTGDYKKNWDNQEDNVHMAEILITLKGKHQDENFNLAESLYKALKERYESLKQKGKLS